MALSTRLEVRRIVLTRVRIPLHEPFRISSGAVSEKESIVVRIETAAGDVGYGEASPMSGSFYSSETPDSTWGALARVLAPRALELPAMEGPALLELFGEIRGEPFAKAGLEGAYWDACARREGHPLCEMLGGHARPIPSGAAIGIYDTVGELIDRVERYAAEGYRRVKIKIEPGWDLEPVAAVRRRFPEIPLMVDANAAYKLADAAVFEQLDRFGLMMFEQPLGAAALEEHAELQRRVRTPICLDESADSEQALDSILALGSARILNIKVQRVGGLEIARRMHDRCAAADLPCWLGTMPELGIASAQGLHLATLPNFTYPTDVEASSRWFVDDLLDPPIGIDRRGWIHLPGGAGSGYRVDGAKLERYAVKTETLEGNR
jgi:O-succinylbenzoate synthase